MFNRYDAGSEEEDEEAEEDEDMHLSGVGTAACAAVRHHLIQQHPQPLPPVRSLRDRLPLLPEPPAPIVAVETDAQAQRRQQVEDDLTGGRDVEEDRSR